jgi:hypothetical protein
MSLFTESQLRSAAKAGFIYKTYDSLLTEHVKQAVGKTFDIFMSHSRMDAELIYGLKLSIEKMGYSIYVDWDVDKNLDRSRVTKETANVLKGRMLTSRCLFFAHSDNSLQSVWMPWELGYFDGTKPSKVAILPISSSSDVGDSYNGQEYLGLYPYVSPGISEVNGTVKLWIHETAKKYVMFDDWLKGTQPTEH